MNKQCIKEFNYCIAFLLTKQSDHPNSVENNRTLFN